MYRTSSSEIRQSASTVVAVLVVVCRGLRCNVGGRY